MVSPTVSLCILVGEISVLSAFHFSLNISKIKYAKSRLSCSGAFCALFSLLRFFMVGGLLPLAVARITNTLKDRFFFFSKLIELALNTDLFLGDK